MSSSTRGCAAAAAAAAAAAVEASPGNSVAAPSNVSVNVDDELGDASAVDPAPAVSKYFRKHGLAEFIGEMSRHVDEEKPKDPYMWMMQYIAQHRPRPGGKSTAGGASSSAGTPAAGGGEGRGKRIRVNIGAVMRRSPKKLLDVVLASPGWEAVEALGDVDCDVYFTWDAKSFLQRLGHPSCTSSLSSPEPVPQLPTSAWVNKLPGMGHLCDKVNMALAIRLLQTVWPEKFSFWPKSWLLPAEVEQLKRWQNKHKNSTVIVKPADGSLGEGIFLAQSASDLDSKLQAKGAWGAGFNALAQKYLPNPLLVGGFKFDLRLYVVITSTDPLTAYLCREGLARFCTVAYEEPSSANAGQHYMHLTNFSVNKRSGGFVRATDAFDVATKASKRPLSTLLRQIEVQEAEQGRTFDEAKFYKACEEVVAVLLQSIAPVLNVTYARVAKQAKPKPKPKPKAKPKSGAAARQRRRRAGGAGGGHGDAASDTDDDEDDEDDEGEEDGEFEPQCFHLVGVDVLMDEQLQPWLLEVNARPSMDIDEPIRLEEAPEGSRRCVCRDMDGEEHVHVNSKVDVHVKSLALGGAMQIVVDGTVPEQYTELNFAEHSPGGDTDLGYTLQVIARLYQVAGGADKAFTTSGARRALAAAIRAGLSAHDLDVAVTRWKHQGYRQNGDLLDDTADIGVLDFATLLQEVAMLQPNVEKDTLEALSLLVSTCDPDDE